ncbi:MAG: ATP-binding protein [Gammaproteobacteria bacterium]
MGKSYQITLQASLENLDKVRRFVRQSGAGLGIVPEAVFELQLAVNEAVSNIVQHGYGGQTGCADAGCIDINNEVSIEMASRRDAVEVKIKDRAKPFNDATGAEPMLATPLNERPYGGMGLYLIHQVTDKVEFSHVPGQGNELRLVKNGVIPQE